MLFISRIRMRNFKSFKVLNVELPQTLLCLAGPNGSGKSNVGDAIRFALGETSLKSLRARSIKDLIHTGSKTAEVTLNFRGDEEIEVKRVIREDGKILYRLNGKNTTRRAILETLKRHNLDESSRNIIAQGEVQRLLNMGGKERRTIIDSVAGIADFEQKKKESIRELETVEGRIKDANLVLGERTAFLDELKREKEVAIKFTESRTILKNSKGTLLQRELQKLEEESAKLENLEEKIEFNRKAKEQEQDEIKVKVDEVESLRSALSQELQSKQKTNALIRRIEELKASLGSKTELIKEKEEDVVKLKKEHEDLAKEIEGEQSQVKSLDDEMTKLKEDLKEAEARAAKHGAMPKNEKIEALRKSLSEAEQSLQELKEKLVAVEADITSKKEIIEAKRQEAERIAEKEPNEAANEGEIDSLLRQIKKTESDIDDSFKRTKEINQEIADLDRDLLEWKEKASIFKVRSSPHLANPALQMVKDLKEKDGSSIFGTVADLIQFDTKYSNAVEAAAGARLLYVVVDHVDTATSVIDKLKKTKSGRATFIPVLGVRAAKSAKMNGFSSVLDVIDFPEEVRPAMEYIFAETLLVDSVADAKAAGIGKARMVTIDGEIFERSGVISGGRTASSILMGNQLKKIEEKLTKLKSQKDGLIQELYTIRDDESRMRSHKSQLEVRMKALDLERRAFEEQAKENEEFRARKAQLLSEISSLEDTLLQRGREQEKLKLDIGVANENVQSATNALSKAEETFRAENEATTKKREELAAAVSSLRATVGGKMKEQELHKKEITDKEERLSQTEAERKEDLNKITEAKRLILSERDELAGLEEKIASASKAIEKIFEKMKSYEDQLQELGKELGAKRVELERLSKDFNQLSIKKATNSTRLEDIRAEFSTYSEFEYLEEPKDDELKQTIAQCERMLAEMGNVNMAAIEMYDKKKAEMDEIQEKIEKLSEERRAIFQMIAEIEEHKKESFFETFYAVSENFKKMFGYVHHMGEGYLYLDKPNDPFESGLHIKIKRDGHEHSLNSLSGGETTIVALMFIFAMQFYKPSPFYILDEVDAALDKPNSRNLADMAKNISKESQVIMVSHNDTIMSNADTVLGVAKVGGMSKLVGVKLKQAMENR